MNVIFKDPDLAEIYKTGKTSSSKYRKFCRDAELVSGYRRAVDAMYDAKEVSYLKLLSYLHYEKLKYRPESSVRILNGRIERFLFNETRDGIEVELIEINKDHYGNKK